jgi:F-type H+-transporting ATPase subunit epsilon
MSDDQLQVELVAADRTVWSGQATRVIARTTEGDVGVLAHHAPLLSVLVHGVVEIHTDEATDLVVAVDGGFLSVANNRVSILSQNAVLGNEIDEAQARSDLEEARADLGSPDRDEDEVAARLARAEAWVRASERAS